MRLLARGDVPQAQCSVRRAREEALAVGRKFHVHVEPFPTMALELAYQLPPGDRSVIVFARKDWSAFGVPQVNGRVMRVPGEHAVAIGQKSGAADPAPPFSIALASNEPRDILSRSNLPNANEIAAT